MGVPAASIFTPESRVVNRWVQLFAGVIATMAISNLQYAWILFTKPLTESLHASLALVQVAFSAFIVAGTWLVPLEGYFVDRLGPRRMLALSGVLVGFFPTTRSKKSVTTVTPGTGIEINAAHSPCLFLAHGWVGGRVGGRAW